MQHLTYYVHYILCSIILKVLLTYFTLALRTNFFTVHNDTSIQAPNKGFQQAVRYVGVSRSPIYYTTYVQVKILYINK